MQIQKVLSNQTTFGTKVKMNPSFIHDAISSGEYTRLRNQIKTLEENGCKDVLSINRVYVPSKDSKNPVEGAFSKVLAEVYEINGNKLRLGNTVASPTYEVGPRGGWHFPNIVNLYEKAKNNLYDCGTQISKWADYI